MTTIEPGRGPTVRWTEHGPEPVEPEPKAPAPANSGDEVLDGHAVQDADLPAAAEQQDPPAGAEPVAPDGGAGEDAAAILARLRARGLLRTEPSIRIREVTGDAPRPVVTFEPEQPLTTGREITDDDLGDPEELEPEIPSSPTTELRCASCRTKQQVPDTATGFKCTSCAKVWRWATCAGCNTLNLTIARQESWRCSACGGYTRSWWRTATKAAEHRRMAQARATEAAERRRREAYAKARRRRWKILTAGAVAILATAIAAVSFTRNAAPVVTRGANGRVCNAFGDIQRSINAQAPPGNIRASVDAIAAESVDAIDRIRIPAQRLAGSGRPGDKPFDDAAKALANACAR